MDEIQQTVEDFHDLLVPEALEYYLGLNEDFDMLGMSEGGESDMDDDEGDSDGGNKKKADKKKKKKDDDDGAEGGGAAGGGEEKQECKQ